MGRYKNLIFYVGVTGAFSLLMYWVVIKGGGLEANRGITEKVGQASQWEEFLNSLSHNLGHPLAILLAQIVTIILAARIFGWLFNKIGQPTVIGEIIAGIVLGPSLVGMYFPDFSAALFPAASLGNLQFLSQIGLILFMFIVGMELDLNVLKSKANDAIVISHASIIIPFALGMSLAYFIYESFAPMGVAFVSFGLFLGIAMSITAFPVLARIVQERGIHKTRLGTVVITCAAADDITAWCILAAVIAIVKAGSFVSSLYVIALAVVYVIFMVKAVRPFLKRVGELHTSRENLSKPIVAIFFLTLIASAYATEVIGIHALFGAFMAGAIMPENAKFRSIFIEKVEDVSLVLLLPLFFVFTGLRTQIGLLNDVSLWKITGLIILVAVVGKFVGSAIAARFVGQNWKDSLTIGALMNTRGLMELVVLNIGFDLGVLTPEIFAMMVIMALVTTFMTGPALSFINWIFRHKEENGTSKTRTLGRMSVLVSFANPLRGKALVMLAGVLAKSYEQRGAVTALHLCPANELNHFNSPEYEKESFAPIHQQSQLLKLPVSTLFKASNDIENDIVAIANSGDYDLMLIGVGQSIYEGSLLGKIIGFTTSIINPERLLSQVSGRDDLYENAHFDDRTKALLGRSTIPVGVLLDKNIEHLQTLCIPILAKEDESVLRYALKIAQQVNARITLINLPGTTNAELHSAMLKMAQSTEGIQLAVIDYAAELEEMNEKTLLLLSLQSWKVLLAANHEWLASLPSTLIVDTKGVASSEA